MINENFLNLKTSYLFGEVDRRADAFQQRHPGASVIRLGVGDVTLPLVPTVIKAMHDAVDECSRAETFKGYGPEHGRMFLREAIAHTDFPGLGIKATEVFVSEGSKTDMGNILDIFASGLTAGIPDPVYPLYTDTCVIAGHKIVFLPMDASNDYSGDIPEERLDLVYLCFPNNPTGAVASREKLVQWVEYALRHGSIILYDSAYESYIRDASIPHSIYEIPGAKDCAIEFRSFSKTAGFTGIRSGYTVIPEHLALKASDGREVRLADLWERRQNSKYNGNSYITQRAAAAALTPEGRSETRAQVDWYLGTAAGIRGILADAGLDPVGGVNAPYLWVRTPDGMGSWEFFDRLLEATGVVVTPGAGFGPGGEGRFRLSAFGERHASIEAAERIAAFVKTL